MATVYFQLERNKSLKDSSHPIYFVLKLREQGREKRYRHYIGRSAKDNHWLGKGTKKRVSSSAPGASTTNDRLETLRIGADAIISNAQNLKINLTLEYFKKRFTSEVLGRQPEQEAVRLTFFEHLQQFIESKKNILQPATIKTYITLKKSLLEFQKSIGYLVDFKTMDQIFLTLYTKYLIEDTGVINNTLAKRIATLKAFLNEMKKQNINTYTDYENFPATRNYETTIMYLTEKELTQLQNLEATNGTQEHIRDAFCFAAHTGIRFSDWNLLTPANIIQINHEGKVVKALRFTMFKVHKEVIIPLDSYALHIIEKYRDFAATNGKLFPVYTNQETNRMLKQLAKEAKINEVIVEVKKSGAKRITYRNAKHEILTCHDARNSYATLYLERGGRPEILKNLLGHTDIKQTLRYVKITEKAVIADYIKISNTKSAKVLALKKPA